MKNTAKIGIGVVAGLATGALPGILFAPEKGKVTRKKIMDKEKDVVNKFNKTMDEAGAMVADIKADVLRHTHKVNQQ